MTRAVSIAQGGSNNVTMRNRIINGNMMIDQRNAGASVTVNSISNTFLADRWFANGENADGVFTGQQVTTAPAGFNNSLKFTITTADASIGATQGYTFRQRIEGYNFADLGWGTSNAKPITISFWVQSSVTGTFGGSLFNNAGDRVYPFSFSISSANTWEQKTVTIAGDITGTWLTTNGTALNLVFSLGVGSSNKGTAGVWSSTFYFAPTGSVDLISTNGATFYITGVQLEAGTTATPFEQRLYGTELALCQRYYIKYSANDGNGGYASFFLGMNASATAFVINPFFPVPLRAPNPTQTWGGSIRLGYPLGATGVLSGLSASNQQIGVTGGYGAYNVTNTGYSTAGPIAPGGSGDTTAFWAFSSEL